MTSEEAQMADVVSSRDAVLTMLSETMRDISEDLSIDGEARPEEQELQIKWTRTLAQLAGQYRLLKRDTDVDEMSEELGLLKEAADLKEDTSR